MITGRAMPFTVVIEKKKKKQQTNKAAKPQKE